MKKLLSISLLSLLAFSPVMAEGTKCGAGKCGSSMQSGKRASDLLHDRLQKDGFTLILSSQKPLVSGENEITVAMMKEGTKITDAKVKIKFFMPEMPGMPYMEYKEKLKLDGDVYRGKVNFTMGGTWQYQLKFKDAGGKVHAVSGSVNL